MTAPLPSFPEGIRLPPSPIVRRIAELASTPSLEIAARDAGALAAASDAIKAGSLVSITWLPADCHDDRIRAARAVRDAGYEPVPHIAARHLRDEAEAASLIRRLHGEAGVTAILLIGGDVARPAGQFGSALELLVRLRGDTLGLKSIGFGGYPEGHPMIASTALETELDSKLAVAEETGLAAFVITQFVFDADPVMRWLEALRARGHKVPVRIGLAGPATLRTLTHYAKICGVGASVRALVKNGASLARLMGESGPDPIIRCLAEGQVSRTMGPVGLHFFPFGGLERTARWSAAVSHGNIRLRPSESGFSVDA